jgi:hypothetical protein
LLENRKKVTAIVGLFGSTVEFVGLLAPWSVYYLDWSKNLQQFLGLLQAGLNKRKASQSWLIAASI